MAAFGLSRTGKQARGRADRAAYQLGDIGDEATDRARGYFGRGEALNDESLAYFRRLMEQGYITPEEIQALGARAMPGLEGTLGRRRDRLAEGRTALFGSPTAGDVMSERAKTLAGIETDIAGTGERDLADIGESAGRLAADEAAYSEAIGKGIRGAFGGARDRTKGTFGNVQQGVRDLYGGLEREAGDVYGGLEREAGSTYRDLISRVKPGSEARAATSARAFAPQMARVAGRLRRAGIDASSPEAANLLSRVEGARSRSMDDRLSDAIEQESALRERGFGTQAALRERGFGARAGYRETGGKLGAELSLQELSTLTGLDLGELGAMTQEQRRNLAARAGMERERRDLTAGARERAFRNRMDLASTRLGEPVMGRGMAIEDIDRFRKQLGMESDEDLLGYELERDRFGLGREIADRDINVRSTGATRVAEQGRGYMDAARSQQGFGAEANIASRAALQDILEREKANSGWGTRLAIGIGGGLLNTFAPGLGSIISGSGYKGGGLFQNPFSRTPQQTNVAPPRIFGGSFGNNPFARPRAARTAVTTR